MDAERFTEVFEADDKTDWKGDNAFQGLQIIAKYFDPNKKDIITVASHDKIYSVGVEELCKAGITEDDVRALRKLNWSIQDEYLLCFV